MLFKLTGKSGARSLEPLPFKDFSGLGKLEKDLEHLLAANLLDILYEDASLMPVFQERALQPEADLYALDRSGNLVIFELKRGFAGADAMTQVLRYGQTAGQWTYNDLEKRYRKYTRQPQGGRPSVAEVPLAEAHKQAFSLDHELLPSEFEGLRSA
jgi:hypothetical protein